MSLQDPPEDVLKNAAERLINTLGKDMINYSCHPHVTSGFFPMSGRKATHEDVEAVAFQLSIPITMLPAAVPNKYFLTGLCLKANEFLDFAVYKPNLMDPELQQLSEGEKRSVATMLVAMDDGGRAKKLIQKTRALGRKTLDSPSPGVTALKDLLVFPSRIMQAIEDDMPEDSAHVDAGLLEAMLAWDGDQQEDDEHPDEDADMAAPRPPLPLPIGSRPKRTAGVLQTHLICDTEVTSNKYA